MPCFVDTNILLYYFATSPVESHKQRTSADILDRDDCVFSVQVLQEFYVQATRPNRPDGLSREKAELFIESLFRFNIQSQTPLLLQNAFEICRRLKFSYWDSAIVAAAKMANCEILFTEDLQHGQVIDQLRVINPFKPH